MDSKKMVQNGGYGIWNGKGSYILSEGISFFADSCYIAWDNSILCSSK